MAQSPGFFLDAWEERVAVIPVSEPETKPASDPTVTITVDVMDTLHIIPKWIFGNNAVTWDNGLRSNSERVICLNHRYARYGTGPDPAAAAAHMAAEWVRYDKGRTDFWEIGNENFGDWQTWYKMDVSHNQDGQPEYISRTGYHYSCHAYLRKPGSNRIEKLELQVKGDLFF